LNAVNAVNEKRFETRPTGERRQRRERENASERRQRANAVNE